MKNKITELEMSGEINTDLFVDSEMRMVELDKALKILKRKSWS